MELGYVTLDDDTDVLEVEFPSGAGMFDPQARDADQSAEDRKTVSYRRRGPIESPLSQSYEYPPLIA